MRVLVCGGRAYDNWQMVHAALSAADADVIIHGGASGADTFAGGRGTADMVARARKAGVQVVEL